MREGRSEVCTINVGLSCALWEEEAVATRTKHIDCVVSGQVGQPNGKDRLALTKDVWASTKRCRPVLFVHGMHSSACDDVSATQKKKRRKHKDTSQNELKRRKVDEIVCQNPCVAVVRYGFQQNEQKSIPPMGADNDKVNG